MGEIKLDEIKLPSAHQIGEPVWYRVSGNNIEAHIKYVMFLTGKVRYGLYLVHDQTTVQMVDSVFVDKREQGQFVEFEPDSI